MKFAGILLLAVLSAVGCSTFSNERPSIPKRTKTTTLFPEVKRQSQQTPPASAQSTQPRKPKAPVKYTRPAVRTTPTSPVPRKFHLPTVIHRKDQSVMVRVGSGAYRVSSENVSPFRIGHNQRLDRKTLPEFWIDQAEITVAQYKRFNPEYDETGYTGGEECPQCPAMAINWFNAQQYCQWAGKRLPTETEWEAAARGTTENRLPWGNQWLQGFGNIHGDGDGFVNAAPTGSFPKGASPFGVLDMIGNVWEWVSTPVILTKPAGLPGEPENPSLHLVKGGGWRSPAEMAAISYRNLVDPQINNPTFGFRCAKSTHSETGLPAENPSQN